MFLHDGHLQRIGVVPMPAAHNSADRSCSVFAEMVIARIFSKLFSDPPGRIRPVAGSF